LNHEIAELLRHEPPMLVLDEVLSCTEQEIVCGAGVADTCPFVRAGQLPGLALLEYMAQAIGVYVTLQRQRHQGGAPEPHPGYLIGARDVELHVPSLAVGELLKVHARLDWNEAQVARFSCRVSNAEGCVAEGRLTVYEREQEAT
jgi:predicted hotdog family 3-hydroxylacyl-ACP dehydratase